jgi:two-component system, sensor histidine kinase and response regulator
MKKVYLFVLLFCAACPVKLAAQVDVPKLEAELEQTQQDTARRIQLLIQLADANDVIHVRKVIQYCNELWNLSQKTGDKQAMTAAAYMLSGAYHYDLQESGQAMDWAIRATDLARSVGDSTLVANAYYRLAAINMDNLDLKRANYYYKAAYKLAESSKNLYMMVISSIALGDIAPASAEKKMYYGRALRYVDKMGNDTIRKVHILVTMGDFFWSEHDTLAARAQYSQLFDLAYGNKKVKRDPESVEMLAHACLRLGKYTECIEMAHLMASLNSPSGNNWLQERSSFYLSEAYHASGRDSLAYFTLRQYVSIHDSLNRKRFDDQVQARVLNIQSEMELQRQEQQLELLQTRGRYETTIAYVLASAVLLLSGIIYYLWSLRYREVEQNRKLEQLNQTKDKLLSIISHDVRSPVQALQNIVDLFSQEIATQKDVQNVARQVGATINNLAAGLDNLFYWAQNQQQEVLAYPENVDLYDLVVAQMEQFYVIYQTKKIKIDNQIVKGSVIYVDALHLRLIFNNVFGNAIKFTTVGGTIKISYQTESARKGGILAVHNEGVPIREEDLPLIFDAGVRYTRPGTKGEPGSGLGLALTRDLMMLNKGTLRLQRDGDVGTLVELEFIGPTG